MSDDLDLRGIDQRHQPNPQFRAALQRRLAAIAAGTDPGSVTETRDLATIDLEPTSAKSAPKRRSSRVAQGILAVAAAAAVVATMAVVISRDDGTTPADTPIPTVAVVTSPDDGTTPADTPIPTVAVVTSPDDGTTPADTPTPTHPPAPTVAASPLEEPSREEAALASDAGTYPPGDGPTEVTAARSYVSLRRCTRVFPGLPAEPCYGPEGWAYVTGSADSPEVHYGLLGTTDELVLSVLDDRYFVASASSSFPQDPPSARLIDSVTGQRGALTWQDQPTTLNSAEQMLALFPAPTSYLYAHSYLGARFLPRVVDRRDWTIRPLSVPEDASAALAIHQPGSGRIWIGTAPDGGDVGLAYTDDGGASWTDVELPESLRPTSEELLSVAPGQDELLVIAATGDHVAVTEAWDFAGELFVSADAGNNWNTVPLNRAGENGRGLFVLSDDRLMVVMSGDGDAGRLLVSSSALDWSQLEESDYSEVLGAGRTTFDVYQQGLVMGPGLNLEPSPWFSSDLIDWWTIPGLVVICTPGC